MNEHSALIETATKDLKPQYAASIKKGLNAEDAYQKIYPKLVKLVAKDLGISEAKTEFEARAILQKIIREVTT